MNSVRRCAKTILPEVGLLLISQRYKTKTFLSFLLHPLSAGMHRMRWLNEPERALTEFRAPKNCLLSLRSR